MDLAGAFLNVRSQQELIDTAVRQFLLQLRQEDCEYAIAAAALDHKIERGNANVSALKQR
ncbi:Uncharacterised protein [Mycobacteroides abscessus subsp. bolletii]|uniref:hypothetical protein n=1 Tax=Mycobacteroides abscessus TaxID=36809 RepID=UPI0009A58015|nr:hypothetical protein [Mycobacteroides abscessus]SKK41013.1 Uncharacterised protein [Mycobacteroides abscessus subsp. bolletii]